MASRRALAHDDRPPSSVSSTSGSNSTRSSVTQRSSVLIDLLPEDGNLQNVILGSSGADHGNALAYREDMARLGIAGPGAFQDEPGVPSEGWRESAINHRYQLCSTYPAIVYVPAGIPDANLSRVAKSFADDRFPVLSYHDVRSGGALVLAGACLDVRGQGAKDAFTALASNAPLRALASVDASAEPFLLSSSQGSGGMGRAAHAAGNLLMSVLGINNAEDAGPVWVEKTPYPSASDAVGRSGRPVTSAGDNQAQGPRVDAGMRAAPHLVLITLGNDSAAPGPAWHVLDAGAGPHALPSSLAAIQQAAGHLSPLCQGINEGDFFSVLHASGWLQQVSALLYWSRAIAHMIAEEAALVTLALEAGCDLTAQISSLVKLIVNPYYRTLEGFQVLVQREWLAMGHPFATRAGLGARAPGMSGGGAALVFVQFLDAVHQLLRQSPTAFEFNDEYLACLAHHSQSCRFGTFLLDNERERSKVSVEMHSLWDFVARMHRQSPVFFNFFRRGSEATGNSASAPLRVRVGLSSLVVWQGLYQFRLQKGGHAAFEKRPDVSEVEEPRHRQLWATLAATLAAYRALGQDPPSWQALWGRASQANSQTTMSPGRMATTSGEGEGPSDRRRDAADGPLRHGSGFMRQSGRVSRRRPSQRYGVLLENNAPPAPSAGGNVGGRGAHGHASALGLTSTSVSASSASASSASASATARHGSTAAASAGRHGSVAVAARRAMSAFKRDRQDMASARPEVDEEAAQSHAVVDFDVEEDGDVETNPRATMNIAKDAPNNGVVGRSRFYALESPDNRHHAVEGYLYKCKLDGGGGQVNK
jgi:hypothetical protein